MGPGGGLHDTKEAAGARGEGLEPSITGPEPVVLPITPPPNGWRFRLAEPVGMVSAHPPGPIQPQLGVVQPFQMVEPDSPAQDHPDRLLQEVRHR